MPLQVSISELEVGPYHITIWGNPREPLRQLGTELYKLLPDNLKYINSKDLDSHAVYVFHPLGEPDVLQREPFRHLHILTREPATMRDAQRILDIMVKARLISLANQDIKIKPITSRVDPEMSREDITRNLARSAKVASQIMKHRTGTEAKYLDEYLSDLGA